MRKIERVKNKTPYNGGGNLIETLFYTLKAIAE